MRKFRQLFIGILIGAFIFSATPVAAAVQQFILTKSEFKVFANGKEYTDKDYPILIYRGINYAPLGKMASLLGVTCTADVKEKRIDLVKPLPVHTPIPTPVATPTPIPTHPFDIDSLMDYFNQNYNSLKTPMGDMNFSFDYQKNDSVTNPYDYWIMTTWSGAQPWDIIQSIAYTDAQKIETKRLLREFQQNIAEMVFKILPNKKIEGGFYQGYYRYPSLKVGYESVKFLTWVNYNLTLTESYDQTSITTFHWYNTLDDYDLTTDDILINAIIISTIQNDINCSASIKVGQTYQLYVHSVYPSYATEKPIWSSSDESVATVDQNGLVTAKKYGFAFIYVKSSKITNNAASVYVSVVN